MFSRHQPTRLDLHFTVFGIPHTVSPWFWASSALMTANIFELDVGLWLVAMACLFVLFFIHELGHALAFKQFKADPIVEFGFLYGAAIPDIQLRSQRQRLITILAGPMLGLWFTGMIYFSDRVYHWSTANMYLGMACDILYYGGLMLNLFNLLPIYYLDGGQVMMELLSRLGRPRGATLCFRTSFVLALTLVGYALAVRGNLIPLIGIGDIYLPASQYTILIFGFLAYQNYMFLQGTRWR